MQKYEPIKIEIVRFSTEHIMDESLITPEPMERFAVPTCKDGPNYTLILLP